MIFKNKKIYTVIMFAALLLVMPAMTGCADNSSSQTEESDETKTEILGTETNVKEIYFDMKYGNIKICPVAESDRELTGDEILVEKDAGENLPDISLTTENGALVIKETEKLELKDVKNYTLYIYLPEDEVFDLISIDNENSYVTLTGDLKVRKMYVHLSVDRNVDISGASIDDLDISVLAGDVNVRLNGEAQEYDYNLSTDHGTIILNGVDYTDITNDVVQVNDGKKSVKISSHGNVAVQVGK